MQKFKKHLAGILLISIAVIAITASSSSEKASSAPNYLLPADFAPANDILLIEIAGDDKQLEEMKSYMSSNYSHKYEFVTWDDLNDDKYANKGTYRFLLRKVVASGGHAKTFDYRFYDRLHNQNYSLSGDEGPSPQRPLEKIVKKIIRKYS